MSVNLDEETYVQLRMLAVQTNQRHQDILEAAIRAYLKSVAKRAGR